MKERKRVGGEKRARLWDADHAVSFDEARTLVEEAFPALAPARVKVLGVGWDNSAFLVNGSWVFRFPRRRVAAALIETEVRLLPAIAPFLPLAVPEPTWAGEPTEGYPFPFAGYRFLPGVTACVARLDAGAREGIAEAMGRFLAALHALPVDEARRKGAGPDPLGRHDRARRAPKASERLEAIARAGLVRDPDPWVAMMEASAPPRAPTDATLVHGDLYARHVLVDGDGRAKGVIDWGDVHLGDPATDLAFAHTFCGPVGREAFLAAYGEVDDLTWDMARFRGLDHTLNVLVYAHDVGDDDLVREGLVSLENLRRGA